MTTVVVVAPHPDDEVLGCTSLLWRRAATVVQITDGVPPWTPASDAERLKAARQAECARAWTSLSSEVEAVHLSFGDLAAWQSVDAVADALASVLRPVEDAAVYLPAYQRGHPDHDAAYVAGALARDRLGPGRRTFFVYGLYGFDHGRRLRFGFLPEDAYGPAAEQGGEGLLEAKGRALRFFESQVWPGSALELWLRSPSPEQFAPLPEDWAAVPRLACYYDEELGFGRHGASAEAVEAAFRRARVALRPGTPA
jgi:LmbE family N-acetylglucosaminyl deacetylase